MGSAERGRALPGVDADPRAGNDLAMTTQAPTNHPQSDGHGPGATLLHRWVLPPQPPKPVNPALLRQAQRRAEYAQNRVADAITAFAGSMAFVYIHILWFACWIGFRVEKYPFGLLTMIVSLEAIFLSTFVLISQNRSDAKRQVVADQQWATVQREEEQDKKLLELSEQMLALIKEVRSSARLAQANQERNAELLDVSRRTLDLTAEVHKSTGARTLGGRGSVESSGQNHEDLKE